MGARKPGFSRVKHFDGGGRTPSCNTKSELLVSSKYETCNSPHECYFRDSKPDLNHYCHVSRAQTMDARFKEYLVKRVR
jgi:hypothetical protein